MKAGGCTYRNVVPLPPKDRKTSDYHEDFPTLSAPGRWATFPPSGGGHYRLWAVWGFYRKPVNPRLVVHNEEHGGVVIWWGPQVPAATVDELHRFYLEQPTGVFGTPIAGLGKKIALTAWTADPAYKGVAAFAYRNGNYGIGRIAICPTFDEKAFRAFRDAYRGKSPQAFPLERVDRARDLLALGQAEACPASPSADFAPGLAARRRCFQTEPSKPTA